MKPLQELVYKILEEVDEDIAVIMKKKNAVNEEYEYWELLPDPTLTILEWQAMRDRKK